MFKQNAQGLVIDDDERPLAVFVDSITTALGTEAQSQTVIFRLHHKDWSRPAGLVPTNQVFQFAMNAPRAAELGRQLLELAAQAEKEKGKTSH